GHLFRHAAKNAHGGCRSLCEDRSAQDQTHAGRINRGLGNARDDLPSADVHHSRLEGQTSVKTFTFKTVDAGMLAVIFAFNKGHAAKLMAKELEKRGLAFVKEDPIEEVNPEDYPKGKVVVLE